MNKKIPKVENGDYYVTKEGKFIFTEQYHKKRGYCCKSNPHCKHCPYQN